MTENKSEDVKKLVVTGNGADLYCGLDTRFSDYMKAKKSIIENEYNKFTKQFQKTNKFIKDNKNLSNNNDFITNYIFIKFFKKDNALENVHKKINFVNPFVNHNGNIDEWTKYNQYSRFGGSEYKKNTINSLDYFLESNYKEFKINDDDMQKINLWDIIMYLNSSQDASWFDLENDIKFFILSKYKNVMRYETSIKLFNKLLNDFQNDEFSTLTDSSIVNYYRGQISENFILYFAIKYLNFNDSKVSFYDILMSQLHVFEKQFSDYINQEIQNHDDYAYNMNYLLKTLTDNFGNHLRKGIYYFNLLTFNYTISGENKPIIDNVKGLQSIHGSTKYNSLNSSNIIMGIDSNLGKEYESLNSKEKQEIYSFTKTSRLLNFKRKKINILDNKINSIVFFGHSLGESDYSYFQSIFDHYNIYGSDVSLTFVYAVHDSDDKKITKEDADLMSRQKQSNKVSHLINSYGDTLDNKEHGKNLLHKMLLEDRISVVNINDLNIN